MDFFSGRPKKVNPRGERFLQFYLDPLYSPEMICQKLSIGQSTFYEYESELNLPQLRIAIGNSSGLPLKKALARFDSPSEKIELDILKTLLKLTGIRGKLIPHSITAFAGATAVRRKEVDFAICSFSLTKDRSRDFFCSDAYQPDIRPQGVLIGLKENGVPISTFRPILGVAQNSVHSEYALNHLSHNFDVRLFRSVALAVQALHKKSIHFTLLHQNYFDLIPKELENTEIKSRPFLYDSYSTMLFHSDSEMWRTPINRALDFMHSTGLTTQIISTHKKIE